jgi:hypothetical protein
MTGDKPNFLAHAKRRSGREDELKIFAAGFDGVELHAASGYLPEQFLAFGSNARQDEYGGPVANRARFVLDLLAAMTAEAGGDRVGIKISPEMNYNYISDAAPQETYAYLVEQLNAFNLAYLHVALFRAKVDYHALLRPRFHGAYLVGGGLDQNSAEALLESGPADATVFGSAFLANPDLPERLRQGAALNPPDRTTFFTAGEQGYTDYPALSATEMPDECRHARDCPSAAHEDRGVCAGPAARRAGDHPAGRVRRAWRHADQHQPAHRGTGRQLDDA